MTESYIGQAKESGLDVRICGLGKPGRFAFFENGGRLYHPDQVCPSRKRIRIECHCVFGQSRKIVTGELSSTELKPVVSVETGIPMHIQDSILFLTGCSK